MAAELSKAQQPGVRVTIPFGAWAAPHPQTATRGLARNILQLSLTPIQGEAREPDGGQNSLFFTA